MPRLALVIALVFALAPARAQLVTGFNQAWLHDSYSHGWVGGFDRAEGQRLLAAVAQHGGRVLRMWLFEGLDPEGVIWDGGAPARGHRTRPTGIDPRKLANLETFLGDAEAAHVAVYLTLFDGNMFRWQGPGFDDRRAEWWNVLNDRFGAGDGFRDAVLAPVAAVLARHRSAIFGVDLVNEGNFLVRAGWFDGGWPGAVKFVTAWRASLRAHAAVPVGMSFGGGEAVPLLLAHRIPAEAVDLFDFHVYDDGGAIPQADAVRAFAKQAGRPVFLGEFGQLSKAYDDALQQRVTAAFLRGARSLGLSAALAWRLSDVRPGVNPEARLSFEAFGRWRPAMDTFQQVSNER